MNSLGFQQPMSRPRLVPGPLQEELRCLWLTHTPGAVSGGAGGLRHKVERREFRKDVTHSATVWMTCVPFSFYIWVW